MFKVALRLHKPGICLHQSLRVGVSFYNNVVVLPRTHVMHLGCLQYFLDTSKLPFWISKGQRTIYLFYLTVFIKSVIWLIGHNVESEMWCFLARRIGVLELIQYWISNDDCWLLTPRVARLLSVGVPTISLLSTSSSNGRKPLSTVTNIVFVHHYLQKVQMKLWFVNLLTLIAFRMVN